MRDLWEADNPFLGEYTEYDFWCYANAGEPDWDKLQEYWEGAAGPRMRAARVEVNADGYALPQLAGFRRAREAGLGQEPAEEEETCTVSFWAYGEVEPAVLEEHERAMCAIWAAYAPPVPAWLAAAPPKMALLLLDGDVVARGEPGSGRDAPEDWRSTVSEDDPWIRYSAAGDELGSVDGSQDWCGLYFPAYGQLKQEAERRERACYEHKGYVIVLDTENWELVEAYDYRGSPVTLTLDEIWAAPRLYEQVGGRYMAMLRQAQLERAAD